MKSFTGRVRFLIGAIVVGLAALFAPGGEGPAERSIDPRKALAPVAPILQVEVSAALQEQRFADAADALGRLVPTPEDRAYYALIQGGAQRHGGRLDPARATLTAAIAAAPQGPWAAKLRSELAAVEVAAGHFAEAERLARAEVTALLAPSRKDRLAGVFQAFAKRLLAPNDPIVPPDPETAYAMLTRARSLAKSETLQAEVLFARARASQTTGNHARTIHDYQTYLKEYPRGAEAASARFHLGAALLAEGRKDEARREWTDLARALEGKADDDLRARALYQAARVPDDARPGQTIAALRRFLTAFPAHPLAVQAAYDLGADFQTQGKTQEALDAFRAFLRGEGFRAETDDARRDRARLAMSATYQVGQLLQKQRDHAEAIAAWTSYLNKFPNGPQSAEAQRSILETQLLHADDHLRHHRYAEARALWETFAAQNPLASETPEVLFMIGQSWRDEMKPDAALAAWETLAGKFPKTESAGHALFQSASTLETEKDDLVGAIARYKQTTGMPWQPRAQQQIAALEAKTLAVVTPRAYRSGEVPGLRITTRNLEALTFSAYKIDPEEYFRKKHALKDVEALDIGLVAPDAEWTVPVPGFAKYKAIETDYALEKVTVPGVWAVKVTDEKTLQAVTLVLGSDLDALVKTSRNQALVFVEDMKTGKGRAGARVLIADESGIVLEAKTGPDGFLLKDWPKVIEPNAPLDVLALDGPNAAGTGLSVPGQIARGLTSRAFLYTDRPAYRPGQEVSLRGIVREVEEGQYAFKIGTPYRLEVTDVRGRQIVSRVVKLAEFGTFHERWPLDAAAPVGTYHVRVYRQGSEFTGAFEVQAYQLEKIDLTIKLPRTVYYRSETIKAEAVARYQYGTPLADRPIEVKLPDGRLLTGKTDASGAFPFELATEGFGDEQALKLTARLPRDNVEATADVMLAVRGFGIELKTNRDLYLDGEPFPLQAVTLDALGQPIGQELVVTVLKLVPDVTAEPTDEHHFVPGARPARFNDGLFHSMPNTGRRPFGRGFESVGVAGPTVERAVSKTTLTTDPKTGRGTVGLQIKDVEGGGFIVRASGTDRFGNPVTADRALTISGAKDERKLRFLTDRQSFRVGETAKVNLHNRSGNGTALLAWEAERILGYKLVTLRDGDNDVTWETNGAEFPNFTLTAARMDGPTFHEARLDIALERDLKVTIAPTRPAVGPGDEVEVEVETRDQQGKPVAAELSLALVDRALLRLYGDKLPTLAAVFYDQTRTGAFTTRTTNTFRYAPTATPLPSALLEDVQRLAAADAAAEAALVAGPPEKVPTVRPKTDGVVSSRDLVLKGAKDPRSQAILDKLSMPIDMQFPNETPLEDVIKYIKQATTGPDGKTMPIYIDPIGLQEAEKTMASPITLDLQGVPLRTTLRLLLAQLGLEYEIEDGLLKIVSQSSHDDGEMPDEAGAPAAGMAGMGMGGMGGGMGGMGGGGAGAPMFPAFRRAPKAAPPVQQPEMPMAQANPADEKKPAPAEKGFEPPPPPPRQQFVETAYWNPSVVTDRRGKGRVKFRAPMALSEYRFTARGVSATETLVGQTTADLAVRKDFFVDLKTPARLTQGDRPRFAARVHHRGASGAAVVTLKVYAGGREEVYPKTIDLKDDGADEVTFGPYEVPEGDVARLTLSARVGEASDTLVAEVPIRPWGVQAVASASGTTTEDTTLFIGLPPGRAYEAPEMLVVIAPTIKRMLMEMALGRDILPLERRVATRILPSGPATTADRASDLLAAASALMIVQGIGDRAAPESAPLAQRVERLATELANLQNEDGGWSWVGGQANPVSDRLTTVRVVWALSAAEPEGLAPDVKRFDRAADYLQGAYAQTDAGDYTTRAALQFGLSLRNKATFQAANTLNRSRDDLPDAALAYLALTLARLDHAGLAQEVLGVLDQRARTETVDPGTRPRRFWSGTKRQTGHGVVETTALVALASAQVRPGDKSLDAVSDWLLAHRVGTGWEPRVAQGPALAALAQYYGPFQAALDHYRLTVTVNDREVLATEVQGPAESRAVLVPRDVLKPGAKNRVHLDIEGRGTIGYAVTLTGFTRDFGPDQAFADRAATIDRKLFTPVPPELDGKTLDTGFSVTRNVFFENTATQVALGGRVGVVLDASRTRTLNQATWENDFLILEDHLPAGTTLVPGSISTTAIQQTLTDDVLTFYFAPEQNPGRIRYEVFGVLPGQYRVLPAAIRSASEPGRSHLGTPGELRVRTPTEPNADPYKPTPDELYARGKALFEAGKLDEAEGPLEALFVTYALRDDVQKDVATMLLDVHIKSNDARKIVRDFEVVREKAPELVLTFDKLLLIGRAYAAIGEFERAYLGWRALAEASTLEDARVGEALRQRGRKLAGVAFLLDLWRESPNTATIESDFFALAQVVALLANEAKTDPQLRRDLAAVGATRTDLLKQATRLIEVFLAQSPRNPMADEASLALVGAAVELEDYPKVVALSERFATLYPRSVYLDSFLFSQALGHFHLGQLDRAVEVAEALTKRVVKSANGEEQWGPNRWEALSILGQIHDARRQPAEALSYYRQVAGRSTDAADAVAALTEKSLTLPEIAIVRPPDKPSVALVARNIAEVDLKVYPVDLTRLFLDRRNLNAIANVDLAGIRPLLHQTVPLGPGEDFETKTKTLDLPLEDEGAYLVLARGDDLYASGVVLVSALELEVREQSDSGRVRVTVRDAKTKQGVPKVQVRVIGSRSSAFQTGQTDLRGVFTAEDVHGQVTAVARQGTGRFAFYRSPAPPAGAPRRGRPAAEGQTQALEDNLRSLNKASQHRQIDRFEKRLQGMGGGMGGMGGGMMGGGFR